MIEIVTIETPSLGDRTYLATDGASALVIDPQRDIGRVLAVAAARGVAVTHVFETHIHNDYVSGGLALARQSGAAYHANAADTVAFGRTEISDGDTIAVGPSMRVRVIATPGHTFTHLAYALEDAATGEVTAVFTGGSLLYGSTGRPDLLGPGSWDQELDVRTACPAHRTRLSASGLRRGALYEPVPDGWAERADLGAVAQPILGVHGTDDPVSPLPAVRARYAAATAAELVSINGGRHDVLNDVTHRTVAATIVLFLERLRLGAELPRIAIRERIDRAADADPGAGLLSR